MQEANIMQTILVVDDILHVRETLEELLVCEGYEAIGASDGREAVQLAQKHHPDLILSDIIMPELDGYEMLTEVRRDPGLSATPVIFFTVKALPSEAWHGLEMGANAYLTKPCKPEILLATISYQLDRQT